MATTKKPAAKKKASAPAPTEERKDIEGVLTIEKISDRMMAMEYGMQKPRAICFCGHTGDGSNSEHHNSICGHGVGMAAGQGACTQCGCSEFMWARHTNAFDDALKG